MRPAGCSTSATGFDPAQLQHALPVADMQLSDELRQACDGPVSPGSMVASFFNTAAWMKWKFA